MKKNFETEILEEIEQQQARNIPQKPPVSERIIVTLKNHKLKTLYTILLAIVTIFFCSAMFNNGHQRAVTDIAKGKVQSEIEEYKRDTYDPISAEYSQIKANVDNLRSACDENGKINVMIKTHEEDMEQLTAQLDEAKALSVSLDAQIAEKQALRSQVNSVNGSASGASHTMQPGTYRCPTDLISGSYKISGNEGNIIVYDISGTVRVSQNLERIDGHEFTIMINSGESLRVDKTVTITEMN